MGSAVNSYFGLNTAKSETKSYWKSLLIAGIGSSIYATDYNATIYTDSALAANDNVIAFSQNLSDVFSATKIILSTDTAAPFAPVGFANGFTLIDLSSTDKLTFLSNLSPTSNPPAPGFLDADLIFKTTSSSSYTLAVPITLQTGTSLEINTYTGSSVSMGDTGSTTAILTGAGSFATSGSGMVHMNRDNTFTGGSSVGSETVVRIGLSSSGPANSPTSGPLGTGTTTVAGILDLNGQTLANALTLSGTLENLSTTSDGTSSGAIAVSTGATLAGNSTKSLIVSGVLSGSAPVTVTGGQVTMSHGDSTFTSTSIQTGATVTLGASSIGEPGSVTHGPLGTGTTTVAGTLDLNGQTLANALTLSGTLENLSATSDGTSSGAIAVSTGATLVGNSTQSLIVSGVLSGSAPVTVTGGKVTLSHGESTFTSTSIQTGAIVTLGASSTESPGSVTKGPLGAGNTTVAGILDLNGQTLANALTLSGTLENLSTTSDGTSSGAIAVSTGATLAGNSTKSLVLSGLVSGSDPIAVNQGKITLSNTGNTFTGVIDVTGGSQLNFTSPGALGSSTTGSAAVGQDSILTGTLTNGDTVAKTISLASNGSLQVDVGSADAVTFSNVTMAGIAGATPIAPIIDIIRGTTTLSGWSGDYVRKIGAGTLSVTSTTGPSTITYVDQGTLRLGADTTNNGTVAGPLGASTVQVRTGIVGSDYGTLDLNGKILYNDLYLDGILANSSSNSAGTVRGALTLGANAYLSNTGSQPVKIYSSIGEDSPPQALKISEGTVELLGSSSNTYTGQTFVGINGNAAYLSFAQANLLSSAEIFVGAGSSIAPASAVSAMPNSLSLQGRLVWAGKNANSENYRLTWDGNITNSNADVGIFNVQNSDSDPTIAASGILTVSGVVSGNAYTKTGAGMVVLSNMLNTYAGTTSIEGGVLKLGASSSGDGSTGPLGALAGGDVSVSAGARLDLAGYSLNKNIVLGGGLTSTGSVASTLGSSTTSLKLAQAGSTISSTGGSKITIASAVVDQGLGQASPLYVSEGTVDFGRANTYTGLTTIGDGTAVATLNITNVDQLNTSSGVTIRAQGALHAAVANNSILSRNLSLSGAFQYAAGADNDAMTLSGSLTAGTSGVLHVERALSTLEVSGALAGGTGTGFRKTGAGTLSLTSATVMDFAALQVSGGTVSIGASATLPQAAVNLDGGVLDISGVTTNSNVVTLDSLEGSSNLKLGAKTLVIAGTANKTYSGAFTSTTAASVIKNTGANTWTLSSDLSGYTGILNVGSGATIALSAAGTTNLSAGEIVGSGTISLGGVDNANPGKSLTLSSSADTALNAKITQAYNGGNVIKGGTGVLTVNSTTSDYTGGTSVTAGTLKIGNSSAKSAPTTWTASPLGTGAVSMGAGVLDLNGKTLHNDLSFSASATLESSGADGGVYAGAITLASSGNTNFKATKNFSLAGAIAGNAGTFYKEGAANLTLSSTSTLTNVSNINVNAGTLTNVGPAFTGITGSDANLVLDGTLDISGMTNNTTQNIRDFSGTSSTSSLNFGTNTFYVKPSVDMTYAGLLTGSGIFEKDGTSTLTFSAAPSITGTLKVTGGTVSVGSMTVGALSGAGTLAVGASGVFEVNTAATNSPTSTFITGSGSLKKSGTGKITLANSNSDYVNTNITGGTLAVSANSTYSSGFVTKGPVGTGTVTVGASGTFDIGAQTLDNPINLSGSLTGSTGIIQNGAVTLDAASTITTANSLTINSAITGGFGFTKSGSGTLNLGASNTYTGDLTIDAGSIVLSANGVLPSTNLILNGALDISNASANTVVSNLSGTGTSASLALGAKSFTTTLTGPQSYAGNITGSGVFTKKENYTLTLSHVQSAFTGELAINAGTLEMAVASDFTLSAKASGLGVLKKSGAAVLTVSNNQSTQAQTLISGGTVTLGASSVYNNTNASITSGPLGVGSVSVDAAGTLNLDTYTLDNPITLTGTLTGTTGRLQNGALTINDSAAAIQVAGTNNFTIASGIVGTVGFKKIGAGTLHLAGTSSYTGETRVTAGSVVMDATGVLPGNQALTLNGTLDISGMSAASISVKNLAGTTSGAVLALGDKTVEITSESSSTYAGSISGSASSKFYRRAGYSVLTLSGDNSGYLGTIDLPNTGGGSLEVTGTLHANQVTSSGGVINLNGGSLTLENSAIDTSLEAVLTGTGSFNKKGTKTLTIQMVSGNMISHLGGTHIYGGRLIAKGSGSVSSTGTITVDAGSTFELQSDGDLVGSGAPISLSGVLTAGYGGAVGGSAWSSKVYSAVTLAANTAEIAAADNSKLVLAGGITGSFDFKKTGVGEVVLQTTNNSYTGHTNITAGKVTLLAGGNLTNDTSKTLTLDGELDISNMTPNFMVVTDFNGTANTAVLHLGAKSLQVNLTANKSYAGTLDATTTGLLAVYNNKTLTLSGDNSTYTGKIWVDGTSGAAATVAATDHLSLSGFGGAGTINIANGKNLTVNTSSVSDTALDAIVTGSGNFIKDGTGSATIHQPLSYSGTTYVKSGLLSATADYSIPDTTNLTVDGTLDVSAKTDVSGMSLAGLSGASTGSIILGANTLSIGASADTTYAGSFQGSGLISKSGTGTLALSGSSATTGLTAFTGGLALGTTGQISLTSSLTVNTVNGSSATSQLSLGTGAILTVYAADDRSISVPMAGAGQVLSNLSATKTLTLNAANTYSGGTEISSGTVKIGRSSIYGASSMTSGPAGVGAITVDESAILDLNGFSLDNTIVSQGGIIKNTAVSASALTNHSSLDITDGTAAITRINTSSGNITLAGSISGAGSLGLAGSNTVTLSGVNTYSGYTSLSDSVAVTLSGTGILPTDKALSMAGTSQLDFSGITAAQMNIGALSGTDATTNVTMGAKGLKVTVNNAIHSVYEGNLTGTGTLTKSGAGIQELVGAGSTGIDAFTGSVVIEEGTLMVGCDHTFASLSGAGTLSMASQKVATLNPTTDASLATIISGAGGVKKSGAKTLTVTGAHTYQGSTVVSDGTLAYSAVAMPQTALQVDAGATLDLTASLDSSVTALNCAATGTIDIGATTFAVNDPNFDYYVYGSIKSTANGVLDKKGPTTMMLSSANAEFLGSLKVTEGTITVSGMQSRTIIDGSNRAGNINLADGGYLTLTDQGSSTVSAKITGNGSLKIDRPTAQSTDSTGHITMAPGTGELNTYTGGTEVIRGTLSITGNSAYDSLQASLTGSPIGTGALTLRTGSVAEIQSAMLYNSIVMESSTLRTTTSPITTLSVGTITLTGTSTIDAQNDQAIFTGKLTGTGALTIQAGRNKKVTLSSSANDYQGLTTVSAGTLYVTGALPTAANVRVLQYTDSANTVAAILDVSNTASSIVNLAQITGTGEVYIGANTLQVNAGTAADVTFGGVLRADAGGVFHKSGSKTYVLTGDSTESFMGSVVTNEGQIQFAENFATHSLTGAGAVSVDAGKKLTLDARTSTSGSVLSAAVLGAGSVEINNAYGATIGTQTSNAHSMTQTGGLRILGPTAAVWSSGAGSTLGTGALEIGQAASFDANGLAVSSVSRVDLYGALKNTNTTASTTVSSPIAIKHGAAKLYVEENAGLTSSGVISASDATFGLIKEGAGTLTLQAVNTYQGETFCSAGTLALDANASIATSSQVRVEGLLDLSAKTQATVQNLYSSQTAGHIILPSSLLIQNTGAQIYKGTVAGSGSVTVCGGDLELSGNYVTPANALSVVLESSLTISGLGYKINGLSKYANDSTGALYVPSARSVSFVGTGTVYASAPIAGSGSVVSTADVLVFDQINTFTGGYAANRGAIKLGVDKALDAAISVVIAGTGSLDLNGYSIGSGNSSTSVILSPAIENNVTYFGTLRNTSATSAYVDALRVGAPQSQLGLTQLREGAVEISTIGNMSIGALSTGPSGAVATIRKTGAGELILGENFAFAPTTLATNAQSGLPTALNIEEGSVCMYGTALPGTTVLSASTVFKIAHSSQVDKKTLTGSISGGVTSTLQILEGWVDLPDSITADHVLVSNAVTTGLTPHDRAILSVNEGFAPQSLLTIDGILLAEINQQDTSWDFDIAGEGILKKYGTHTLTLNGNLSTFTGGLQIQQGVVSLNDTWSGDLEVFAGSTLLSDVHTSLGTTTTISGDLFGAVENNGQIYIGNHSGSTQVISASQFTGDQGAYFMDGTNTVYIRSTAQNNTLGSLQISSGHVVLDGVFNISSQQGISVLEGGLLELSAGAHVAPYSNTQSSLVSVAHGTVRAWGVANEAISAIDTMHLTNYGKLDVAAKKINDVDANVFGLKIGHLHLSDAANIILRPDVNAMTADLALLEIEGSLTTGSLLSPQTLTTGLVDKDFAIRVIPQGQTSVAELATYKLIKLSEDLQGNTELKEALLDLVCSTNLYDVRAAAFNNEGVLECTLYYKGLEGFAQDPVLAQLPSAQFSLFRALLSQQTNTNIFTMNRYNMLNEATTETQIKELLDQWTPISSQQSPISTASSAVQGRASSMMGSQKVATNLSALMQGQGLKNVEGMKRGVLASRKDLLSAHIAHATNPEESARMRDFQNIDLNGLSFSSDLSYSHQVLDAQSDAMPGTTQNTWANSIGVSYSKNRNLSLGVVASTSKILADLNANQLEKTNHRSDRYNAAAVMGLYQSDKAPWYMVGMLSYGQHNNQMERTWVEAVYQSESVACEATSTYKAYETSVNAEFGWKYKLSDSTMLQPYAGFVFTSLSNQAYTEDSTNVSDGAPNDYGLIVSAQSQTTQQYSAGVELLAVMAVGDGHAQFTSRFGWTTQKAAGQTSTFEYAYLGDPSAVISMEIDNIRYNTFDVNLGAHAEIRSGLFITGQYTGNFGSSLNTQTVMVSAEYYMG